ncbi:hypothetical protein [Roseimicrobium sp. ORNL1]|uniref:hypothetical protein n=1 Tax=Roseimicrobium sp. ORNL1 TaxID=2711231 RepID=UPI0013E1E41D|nr:hypothetical protein [Roseimicrobium sp. ORNL1]QIF00765.1 hypothetical protein G5S37_04245 [Roseimicrobium sp. ORNL1]
MGRYFTFTEGTLACAALACSVLLAVPLRAEDAPAPAPTLEPTRHELWVPTKDLKEVLEKHPNAVVLDREQYMALIRDAGRVGALKEQAAPVDAVIEDVKVTARVSEDVSTATLTYEFHVHNLKDGWSEVSLPFALGSIRSTLSPQPPAWAGPPEVMLTDLAAEKPIMVNSDEKAWKTTVLSQGKGRHVLRVVFVAQVSQGPVKGSALGITGPKPRAVAMTAGPKGPQYTGSSAATPVRLELPPGWKPASTDVATRVADGAWDVMANAYSWSTGIQAHLRTFFMFRLDLEPAENLAKGAEAITQSQVSILYGISTDRVSAAAELAWSGAQPRGSEKLRVSLPKEARVLHATTYGSALDVMKWEPVEGGVEFQSPAVARNAGKVLVEFEVPWAGASDAVHLLELPAARIDGAVITRWDTAIMAESDVGVRLNKLLPFARPVKETDKYPLRTLAKVAIKGVGVGALIQSAPAEDLFRHPRFVGGFSFDALPDKPLVEVQMVPDRFSVDADALVEVASHEVSVVRTLVFHGEAGSTSRAVVTLPESEVFLEIPVTSGEHVLWKQVSRDIEVTWPQGLGKGEQTSLTIRTRRDIPPNAADGTASEKVAIASLPVSGASRVSGYAALKFDESWKVNVTDTTGLEMRDARATPVRGRMAWFGLKEWKLGFDLSRRSPVHDATITAYALPRAKQVEIEGQIALSVSGAPLRKFEVKLPVSIAPLLRVTSPLVGEQSLDAATGVWTLTLGRELIGAANVRFRMSLPADKAPEGSAEGTLTTALPDITVPGARRTAGRWVVEANTDTELAFATRGVQPLDSRRPPSVQGYSPQHRVIAAYSHGGGEHEIRLTATRHDPASLAGMVLIHLRMTSVLGQDGSARHEAVFTLRHNGRQFATIRLPEGVGLLSTMVDGKVVKPVKAGTNEVRLPLSSRIGDSAPIEVKVIYDTPSGEWGGSGRVALTPPTLGDEVPVMETQWKVYTPGGFTLAHAGSGLVEDERGGSISPRAPGFWENLFGRTVVGKVMGTPAEAPVDFLSGGGSFDDLAKNEEHARMVAERLNKIILPSVQFAGASLTQAIDFLRIESKRYDHAEPDPAKRGVNLVVKPEAASSTATISLDLKDVSLLDALRYVTELSGAKYRIESFGITIVPISDVRSEMYSRKFKLTLAQMLAYKEKSMGMHAPSAPRDPFAPAGGDERKPSTGEFSLEAALKAEGIPFPEGAVAVYDRDAQMLLVRNTQPSLDLVDSLLDSLRPDEVMVDNDDPNAGTENYGQVESPGDYYIKKMSRIIFPFVEFNGISVEEAIEYLRIKSKDYDQVESDRAKRGVNLIVKPGAAPSTATISLDLKDVPMSEALRYVTELGGMKYKVEPYAVVVVPISDVGTEMYTRTFKVPPDFLTHQEVSPPAGGPDAGLAARPAANSMLTSNGIPFPEGGSATFIPATSQLIVRNTQSSLDLVESYVNALMKDYIENRRNASLNRAKSGLVPLELELPTSGQVLVLHGHQRPKEFALHYLSWERQATRTSLLVLLGATLFWVLRNVRIWFYTFVVVLVLVCGPILILPSWTAEFSALLAGWMMALGVWLLWKIAEWWRERTRPLENSNEKEVVA